MSKAQGSLEYLLLIGGAVMVGVVIITLLYVISGGGIDNTDTTFRDVLWQQVSTGSKIKDGSFEDPPGGSPAEFVGGSIVTDSYFNAQALHMNGGTTTQTGSHLQIMVGREAKAGIWVKNAQSGTCTGVTISDCTFTGGETIGGKYEKQSYDCILATNTIEVTASGDCYMDGLILKAA